MMSKKRELWVTAHATLAPAVASVTVCLKERDSRLFLLYYTHPLNMYIHILHDICMN